MTDKQMMGIDNAGVRKGTDFARSCLISLPGKGDFVEVIRVERKEKRLL